MIYGELAQAEFIEWLEEYLELDESPDLQPIRDELEVCKFAYLDQFDEDDE